MTFPPMRPQIEIQRVHDMLRDVLGNEEVARSLFPRNMLPQMIIVADCLCWILHHDIEPQRDAGARTFGMLIDSLRRELEAVGAKWEGDESEYIVEE